MSRRILIVDAVATNRIVLRVKLATAYYEVSQADSAEAAFAAIERLRPDLIIAATHLPDMSGHSFCAALRALPGGAAIPVIMIVARDDPSERLAALASGSDDVLARPIDDLVLMARLRSLLRARDAEAELELREDTRRALGLNEAEAEYQTPAHVMLVAPTIDPAIEALHQALDRAIPDTVSVFQPETALGDLTQPPDVVVILEPRVSKGAGLTLLAQLRAQTLTRNAALIYVAHPHQRREAAAALDMGASDLVAVGPEPEELALRIRKQAARKRTSDRLRADMRDGLRAALTDPLTGLYNRRYALPHLMRVAERALALDKPFAVLMADLDHFKHVNDTYGHSSGDAVLVALAERMRMALSPSDLIARYGGEEFLAIMPDTNAQEARASAERLCRAMGRFPIRLPEGQDIHVTLSVGLTVCEVGARLDAQSLIDQADRALYCAKDAGRNQVFLACSNESPDRQGWQDLSHPVAPLLKQVFNG